MASGHGRLLGMIHLTVLYFVLRICQARSPVWMLKSWAKRNLLCRRLRRGDDNVKTYEMLLGCRL